tara:strand:- start:168 stop:953 length:786 start_codon:yes stop_codon:yes gene_type:complete
MMTNENPGGHGERAFAAGALDVACWDIVGKLEEKPLYKVFAERYNYGNFDTQVAVYPGGRYYYPEGGTDLNDERQGYRDAGYLLMKMTIGDASIAKDLARIESVLKVTGEGKCLAVDANASISLDQALEYVNAISDYKLAWFEEPVDPLDYGAIGGSCKVGATLVTTGESLFSIIDAENLLRYGGLRRDRDWLQFDPSLMYGPSQSITAVRMRRVYGSSSRRHGPHGGQQLGLHLAAGLQLVELRPIYSCFSPSGVLAMMS